MAFAICPAVMAFKLVILPAPHVLSSTRTAQAVGMHRHAHACACMHFSVPQTRIKNLRAQAGRQIREVREAKEAAEAQAKELAAAVEVAKAEAEQKVGALSLLI